jgi:hypothetical protein
MTLIITVPMLPSGISSPRRVPLVPGSSYTLTLTRCWRNAKYFFACRRWTWMCKRRYWRRIKSVAYIPLMVAPVVETRHNPHACG